MKKKLKDFTQKELDDFCKQYPACKGCPLDTHELLCVACEIDLWGDLEVEYEKSDE